MGIRINAVMAIAALAGAGLVGAQAATAATAPSVKMTQPTFQSLTADGVTTNYPVNWDASFTIPWTVTAPAGVCGQTLTNSDYNDQGGPDDPYLGGPSYTQTISKTARSWNGGDGYWLDWARGGENAYVTVKECNGVKVRSNPVHVVLVTGDDHNPNGGTHLSFSSGNWAIAHCTCFLGGTATYTTVKGASVSFSTPQPADATGVRVALLMPEGPSRGSAAIYVDNKYLTTVSTYHAGANVNGKINYQFLLTGTHTHVVRIVNLATTGHPRIDVDATIN